MGRSILAVVAGLTLWSVLWVGGAAVFGGEPGQPVMAAGPLLGLIAYSVILSFLSGWTTGRLAPAGEAIKHATILAVLLLAIGIMVEVSGWDLAPAWYHLVFLALLVPATLAGGRKVAGRAGA